MSSVQSDTSQFKSAISRLEAAAKNAPIEIKRLVSSLSRAVKTESIREVQQIYSVRRASVASRTRVELQGVDAIKITAARDPINLMSFSPRQLGGSLIASRGYGSGVRVTVLRGGPAATLTFAFIARSPVSDENLVYQRRTKGQLGKNGGRLKVLFGPSVADAHARPKFVKHLGAFFFERGARIAAQRTERLILRG